VRNHRFSIPLLGLFAVATLAAGCIDNSGGPPPPGDKLEYERVSFLGMACGRYQDKAWLIEDQAGLDAYWGGCEFIANDDRQTVEAAVADLAEGDVLLGLDVELGGCIGETAFMGAYKEGDTLHAWLLKGNSAYGRGDVACTADIGEAHEVVRVFGAGEVADVDITVGIFNPDLPGAPALPGG